MSSRSRTIQVRIDYSRLSDLRRVDIVKGAADRVLEDLKVRIDYELRHLIMRYPELEGVAEVSIHELGV